MPQITSTQRWLGGATDIIVMPGTAETEHHRALSPCSMLVYAKPAETGEFMQFVDRQVATTTNGVRLYIGTDGSLRLTVRSSSSTFSPNAMSVASLATVGAWHHFGATWDGSRFGSGIELYHATASANIAKLTPASRADGSATTLYPSGESATRGLRLLNNGTSGTDWPFKGDCAYIAIWKGRVLTDAEMLQAQQEGPLNVHPDDLVLLWANGADLTDYAIEPVSSSAYGAGDLPPNLILGGALPLTVSPIGAIPTIAAVALPDPGLTISPIGATPSMPAVTLQTITVHDDFERSSVNAGLSTVTVDVDDVQLVTLNCRMQYCVGMGLAPRWLEPLARVSGVLGKQPRFEFVPYQQVGGDNRNHQTTGSAQYPHWSYDGVNWVPFGTKTYSTRFTGRHTSAFTEDVVYVARSWPRSLTQIGNQVAALASAYPDKIFPAPSASAFTPTNTTSFPAQAFIAAECDSNVDELGRAVPHTPIYAFEINDTAHTGPKKDAHYIVAAHAGEDVGEIIFWEAVDFILNSAAVEAQHIRQNYRIFCYPCANPSGKYAGFWRGAPGSNEDPNRHWLNASPPFDSITKMRDIVLSDHGGRRVWWCFNVHASPGGARLQVGPKSDFPATIAWDSYARGRFPVGDWGDYYDRNTPSSSDLPGTVTQWQKSLTPAPVVQMLLETCDRPGPISPTVMRPYAEATVGAIYDVDQAGWFADPLLIATGTDSVSSLSGTVAVTGTLVATGTNTEATITGLVTVPGELVAVGTNSEATLTGEIVARGAVTSTGTDSAAILAGTVNISGTLVSVGTDSTATLLGGSGVQGEVHASGTDTTATLAGSVGVSGTLVASGTNAVVILTGATTVSGTLVAVGTDSIATLVGGSSVSGEIHAVGTNSTSFLYNAIVPTHVPVSRMTVVGRDEGFY